jgi:aminoglycoside phosphotransferase (APT) family kinase protein
MADRDPEEEQRHRESSPSTAGLEELGSQIGSIPTVVRRLGGGLAASTHLLLAGGERLVLKRAFPGTDVTIEFENLRHAARGAVPTPRPVACDPDGRWFATPAFVMTAVPGRQDLRPDDLDGWIGGLARALAALHEIATADVHPVRPPRWERWEPWETTDRPLMHAITRCIGELGTIGADQLGCFTHDDYHPGNVLFDAGRLSGVVDWSHVAIEPRGSAVAYCRSDLAIHPGGDAPDRFLRAYEAEIGTSVEQLAHWDVLQAERPLRWGHLWPPAFAEAGIELTAAHIELASRTFITDALRRLDRTV